MYILQKENEFCVLFLFWLEEIFLKGILQSESPKGGRGDTYRILQALYSRPQENNSNCFYSTPLKRLFFSSLGGYNPSTKERKVGKKSKISTKEILTIVYLSTDLNIELIILPLSTIFNTTTVQLQGSTEWRIISVHLDSFVNPEWPFQILNLLQVIWNWYDMDPVLDLYPNHTFSKLPQQNCSFIFFAIFVRLL